MTYTAKTAPELRQMGGTLAEKLAGELTLIDTAIDALGAGTGALADGKVWIGDATNACAQKTLAGDVTTTRAGVTTCKPLLQFDLSSVVIGTTTTGILKIGATAAMMAIDTADQIGIAGYFSSTSTSGTTYGQYIRLNGTGAGEKIAGRNKVLLTAAGVTQAYGHHATLELDTSAGSLTGLGVGMRGNVVVADRAVTTGSYYGVQAEIYPLGNSAALPAGSNACINLNCQAGTAMALVGNAIHFSGTDGTGKMIYTATDTHQTYVGSVRILVNGVVRYLHFSDDQAATS